MSHKEISPAQDDQEVRPVRRRRVRGALLVGTALAAALAVGMTPAHAADSNNGASAYEQVQCDAGTHSVQVNFEIQGEDSGSYTSNGFNDLYPKELIEPVYVKVWVWQNGQWASSDWWQLPEGSDAYTFPITGTSYWYFSYAFMTPTGTFDYASEWAGGTDSPGIYSGNGYNTLRVCTS